VWDFVSDKEAVDIVAGCIGDEDAENRAGRLLVERALANAAKESGLTTSQLLALPQGSKRRSIHDDTTAVVVFF
jgi:pyruvate dehydrogenase phosphatase